MCCDLKVYGRGRCRRANREQGGAGWAEPRQEGAEWWGGGRMRSPRPERRYGSPSGDLDQPGEGSRTREASQVIFFTVS